MQHAHIRVIFHCISMRSKVAKILTFVPRLTEVIDTKNYARFRK